MMLNKNLSFDVLIDLIIEMMIAEEIIESKKIFRNNPIRIKGNTFLDAGYIFAPYIAMTIAPDIVTPNEFKPKDKIMSRYAATTIKSEFWGRITIGQSNSN